MPKTALIEHQWSLRGYVTCNLLCDATNCVLRSESVDLRAHSEPSASAHHITQCAAS